MIKFVYYKSVIYECDVTQVYPTPWECKSGEQLYIINAPEKFKDEKWYSHFLNDTVEQTYEYAKKIITAEIENSYRKKKAPLTEWQLGETLKLETNKIWVAML